MNKEEPTSDLGAFGSKADHFDALIALNRKGKMFEGASDVKGTERRHKKNKLAKASRKRNRK